MSNIEKILIFSTRYLSSPYFSAKNVQKRYQMEGVLAYNTASFVAMALQEQHESNTQTTFKA
jgi:hypothetical protein